MDGLLVMFGSRSWLAIEQIERGVRIFPLRWPPAGNDWRPSNSDVCEREAPAIINMYIDLNFRGTDRMDGEGERRKRTLASCAKWITDKIISGLLRVHDRWLSVSDETTSSSLLIADFSDAVHWITNERNNASAHLSSSCRNNDDDVQSTTRSDRFLSAKIVMPTWEKMRPMILVPNRRRQIAMRV